MIKKLFLTFLFCFILTTSSYAVEYTADVTGSGTASASEVFSGFVAANGFENDISSYYSAWGMHNTAGWLKYDFGAGVTKTITKYTLVRGASALLGGASDDARCPKNWTFQGSNNDSDWDTLDTVTNETDWTSTTEVHIFTFSNTTAYRYYQIVISANNGNAYTGIGEMEMMETIYRRIISIQ